MSMASETRAESRADLEQTDWLVTVSIIGAVGLVIALFRFGPGLFGI